MFVAGSGAFKQTEKASANLICRGGYIWSDGTPGTSSKLGRCTRFENSIGLWITSADCVSVLLNFQMMIDGTRRKNYIKM